ncbi:CheW protein [Paramagnetospirillum caucaseum]|uniref:CheW protein n=1 Tax=Paramagnetospirillum caucaseum TaxID=1244869 RepID=M2Z5G0_9PROT|nr:chemotaxis protein CheW [Paramagnetospirillum caucaseum]EME69550.1 CheW protein [Paramagnetospirillum caucaseum]
MSQIATSDRAAQYVTLGIDKEIFAVEVERVHEILDLCPISRIPNAPPYLMGMIDVRRCTVPVVDLRVKLGLPAAPPTPSTRIIVLDVATGGRNVVMGLVADRVYEVTGLADHPMEAAPNIGIRWNSQFIKAVGRRGDAFVIVLDIGYLFSGDETALIAMPDRAPQTSGEPC